MEPIRDADDTTPGYTPGFEVAPGESLPGQEAMAGASRAMPREAIVAPEESIVRELEEQRPKTPVALLSSDEKVRLTERGFLGLYRWYVARSQETRNWNPDTSFDLPAFRKDHSDIVHTILEGFFAVEQYVPDYVTSLMNVIRKSHGRSHFHLRWGSEEEKHADMWRNAVLFGGKRSLEWTEEYMADLRSNEWRIPWDDPLHMIFYTVFQERATQVNYLNLGLAAKGLHTNPAFAGDKDPVLAQMCQTIAVDEAAHYNFFLEGARLFLYYYPEESAKAMVDVLRHFGMPAGGIIPDYDHFSTVLYKNGIFGPREHAKDVVKIALEQLGAESLRAVEKGIAASRMVPDRGGNLRATGIFESIDFGFVEAKVQRLFGKINDFERKIGVASEQMTRFLTNPGASPQYA